MKIPIDKFIPLVKTPHGGGPKTNKYPFEDMVVGDSFLVKCTKDKAKSLQSSVKGCADRRVPKMSFTTSYLPDKGGVRIWRIA